jgi:hypothetical protein
LLYLTIKSKLSIKGFLSAAISKFINIKINGIR